MFFTRSRRVTLDVSFDELAIWIKAGTAGDVVWYNEFTDEYGVWNLEAGEVAPIGCTKIVTSATVGGVVETTTAGGMFWASSADRLGIKTGF